MGEIVNLRRVKKQRAKAEAEELAAANRARHGLAPDERERQASEAKARDKLLDQSRIEPDET